MLDPTACSKYCNLLLEWYSDIYNYHVIYGCLQGLTYLVLSFHWELDNQLLWVLHSEHIGRLRLPFRELGRMEDKSLAWPYRGFCKMI